MGIESLKARITQKRQEYQDTCDEIEYIIHDFEDFKDNSMRFDSDLSEREKFLQDRIRKNYEMVYIHKLNQLQIHKVVILNEISIMKDRIELIEIEYSLHNLLTK